MERINGIVFIVALSLGAVLGDAFPHWPGQIILIILLVSPLISLGIWFTVEKLSYGHTSLYFRSGVLAWCAFAGGMATSWVLAGPASVCTTTTPVTRSMPPEPIASYVSHALPDIRHIKETTGSYPDQLNPPTFAPLPDGLRYAHQGTEFAFVYWQSPAPTGPGYGYDGLIGKWSRLTY